MRKTKGNATQNLTNVMQMLYQQQELIESYQPQSKDHEIKKRSIVGLQNLSERDYQKDSSRLKRYAKDSSELLNTGPQTDGSPYKDLKAIKGKSAPPSAPGGGSMPSLEEGGQKIPTKTYKIKIITNVEERKKRKKRKKHKKKGTSPKRRSMYWPYWGCSVNSSDGDVGGDGGGGE